MDNEDEVEIKDFAKYIEKEIDAYVEDIKKSKLNPKKIVIRKIILNKDGTIKPELRDKLFIQIMGQYTKHLIKGGKAIGCLQDRTKEVIFRNGKFLLRSVRK